jgi:hypothetical protein
MRDGWRSGDSARTKVATWSYRCAKPMSWTIPDSLVRTFLVDADRALDPVEFVAG